jgi:hypothetical protein
MFNTKFWGKEFSGFSRQVGKESDLDLRLYLDAQYCTRCDHNCRLSGPRCRHGEKRAKAAKMEYGSQSKD